MKKFFVSCLVLSLVLTTATTWLKFGAEKSTGNWSGYLLRDLDFTCHILIILTEIIIMTCQVFEFRKTNHE
jgi:hypothetical protein